MNDRGLRRFFVKAVRKGQGACSITGSEARHICRVLRMEPGERLVLVDQEGNRFLGSILQSHPREVRVAVEKALPFPGPPPVEICMCQALIKSGPMDDLIRKTSELGVASISLFFSERTVIRMDESRIPKKMDHWKKIALAATKQSDRHAPARIEGPSPFVDLVARWKSSPALKVILWEGEGARDLKSLLHAVPQVERVVGIVGPEGGFAEKEVALAGNAGFISASLGDRILRSETAAVTMVTIIQYEWGDLGLSSG